MTQADFSAISASLPTQPGIYKYYDADDTLLYVGKAKNIRKRVSSYFSKTNRSYKTRELVQRIARMEFTITDTEQDALLLENALIKQFKPRFNIDLKDDKTYPYIVIRKEAFPRVFFTRRKIADGSEYLGPFPGVGKVRELLEFIRQQIPLRTCRLDLSPAQLAKGKYKVCLEYHLGNCKGPCAQLESEESYQQSLQQVRHILRGNIAPVLAHYREQLKQQISELAFEDAALTQKKLDQLQQYQARSTIVSERVGTVDVFSLLEEGDRAYVNYLAVNSGTIVITQTIELQKQLDEPPEEVLGFAIEHLRSTFNSAAKEVVVPFMVSLSDPSVSITVPAGGDKRKLLDLSQKNTNYFSSELKQKKLLLLEAKTDHEIEQVLQQMQTDLKLPQLPVHIECFDNSNFHGSYPVSAMVCFKNGLPSKNDYRKYHVKTVTGANDFATMKEVVYRRYHRVITEGSALPQLVIIDGGKGQLGAAMDSIRALGLTGKLTVVGLAKQAEELFYPGDGESLQLPWNSESLRLIRRIRDEVHRFGITFHRHTRSKGALRNELEDIPGIGKTLATRLLSHFRSVSKVKQASQADLEAVVGKGKAALLRQHFDGL